MSERVRLEKRVAELGELGRSGARAAIRRGRVAVDGVPVRDPAASVPADAAIALDGVTLREAPTLVLFHKPLGVQSTVGDPWGRANLETVAADLLAARLHPVGRLDADTDGLLLFGSDGTITQRLLHPRHAVAKRYVATVAPAPGPELVARLAEGVETADGLFTASVLGIEEDRVTLEVTEGKHRMVRRMLANAGHPVVALRRVAFGALTLGELAPGAWREPDAAEAAWLTTL